MRVANSPQILCSTTDVFCILISDVNLPLTLYNDWQMINKGNSQITAAAVAGKQAGSQDDRAGSDK